MEEENFFLSEAEDKAKNMQVYLRKILRLAEEIEEDSGVARRLSEQGADVKNFVNGINDALVEASGLLFQAYWCFTEPYTFDGSRTYFEAITSEEYEKCYKCFSVKSDVVDGRLVVKLPLLSSRYTYNIKRGNTVWTDYVSWFKREIFVELTRLGKRIPHIGERNFTYLHVVPQENRRVTDNDNYDTKSVTDAITEFFPGDDNAMVCSFAYYSCREGDLQPGSYVIVSSGYENPPSLNVVLDVLKRADFS